MKIIHLGELNCWAVAEYPDGEEQLPTIKTFATHEQAKEYKRGNKPSLLTKFKLLFERH